MAVDCDENDIKAMKDDWDGANGLLLVDAAAGTEEEVIRKFESILPDVVILNAVNDTARALSIIKKICSITHDEYPPLFMIALKTDETDLQSEPVIAETLDVAVHFPRYGAEHSVKDIIEWANEMKSYIKTKEERHQKEIVWQCE